MYTLSMLRSAAIRLLSLAAFGSFLVGPALWADPPPPNQQSSCGGNCQAICINGCDGYVQTYNGESFSSKYDWAQARCVTSLDPRTGSLYSGWYTPGHVGVDAKGTYCLDNYNCDFGPCGREGERPCNTNASLCTEQCRPGLKASGISYWDSNNKCVKITGAVEKPKVEKPKEERQAATKVPAALRSAVTSFAPGARKP